ncbi:MAG: sodium:solute symporter family protein [Acidobacteriota bacterium]|nr:sodium:solute symporter family protein [Acidobacteriota bacterium]
MTEVLLLLGVSAVLVLAAGMLSVRKADDLEAFFLASRSLPSLLVALSLCASWIGAASVLVSADSAYADGLSAFWIIGLPALLTLAVFGFVLARPIRSLPFISLPDLLEIRYGRTVRHIAAVLIIGYMALLAASQMAAAGLFFKSFLEWPYAAGVVLATGLVIVYAAAGGFFSVVVTDGLQFILISTGILGIFASLGGFSRLDEAAAAAARAGRDGFLDFFSGWEKNILMVFSFTLAWIISPIVWQRIQAARSVGGAKKGLLLAAIFLLAFYGFIVISGMNFRAVFPEGFQDHNLLAAYARTFAGPLLRAVVFAAVAAAVMSTMDTAINAGALSLTRDVYQVLDPGAAPKKVVMAGRVSTLIVAGAAMAAAFAFRDILKILGLASAVMAQGLFIPGAAMILFPQRRPRAGLFALLLGGGYAVAGVLGEALGLKIGIPEWPHSVPAGVGLSLLGYFVGFGLDRKSAAGSPEIR